MNKKKAIFILKKWRNIGTKNMTSERLGYIEGWFGKDDSEAFAMAIKALEEHKTGRWISEIAEREDWRGIKRKYFQPNSCSVCHNPSNIGEDYPYCPNCGAKMEGSDRDAEKL